MTPTATPQKPRAMRKRRQRNISPLATLLAGGEPLVWLTGSGLVIALAMIASLVWHVCVEGFGTFWPGPVVAFELTDGSRTMGELTDTEVYVPDEGTLADVGLEARGELDAAGGESTRIHLRSGNFDLTGTHTRWLSDFEIVSRAEPEWAVVVERRAWGRFYGEPSAFRVDGEVVATRPPEIWRRFEERHAESLARFEERQELEEIGIGRINQRVDDARVALRERELEWERRLATADGAERAALEEEAEAALAEARARFEAIEAEATAESAVVLQEIRALNEENARFELVLETAAGREKGLVVADVVRAYPANQLGTLERLGVYLSRWWEFVWDEPREANSEGGVFPAIFGTVVMTLVMSLAVVPFGVLAALYLREYARQGLVISAVRIAVNNLAGVPSIVFGVFGLGFFCYIIGGGIDRTFYEGHLPNPTYGTGGLMWASLTLALLTLPVVIVATEEALSAVPSSMREGSYACGATKWQTIRRIVLPRAMPGIMTGMILAIARGAGEVAPLMLVGAVKLAPELPVDLHDLSGDLGPVPTGPLHLDRSFMHLGFHIYDLGFKSQNVVASAPMVYTTTLLLIGIIVALNVIAITVRARLRRKFEVSHI